MLKTLIFCCSLIVIVGCQSGKRGDSYASSPANRYKEKKQRDTYSASNGKSKSMKFNDSYSGSGSRKKSKEGTDSYTSSGNSKSRKEGRDSYSSSSSSSSRGSFRKWMFWKRDKRNKTTKSYNVSRKRKIFKKRKPPQGIKAS
jgi:hypothetical protein